MNQILGFFLIAFFAVFLGSQITEGFLLVPYWKTLPASDFYNYYIRFGPIISRFYTILTLFAVLIPLSTSIYCFFRRPDVLKYSLISTFWALVFIASFYMYFKETNQKFYDAAFNVEQLKSELITWSYWHWSRVITEVFSLTFLILAFNNLIKKAQ